MKEFIEEMKKLIIKNIISDEDDFIYDIEDEITYEDRD